MVLHSLEVALPATAVEALSLQRVAFRVFNFLGEERPGSHCLRLPLVQTLEAAGG
jgi:hypothetical protein